MRRVVNDTLSCKTAAIRFLIAAAFALCCVTSCSKKTEIGKETDMTKVARQVVDGLYAIQTTNGSNSMRMEAKRMEKYEHDSLSYELFPKGFDVYGYNENGDLETHIHSRQAKHTTVRKGNKETWAAFGDVVILNFIKGQKLLTDTLYWNQSEHKIYTDCLVKMSSPRGYMQGIGMESDEMARNAVLQKPFDSFTRLGADSVVNTYIDTVNVVGPVMRVKKGKDLRVKGKEEMKNGR
ncbi:MAG: LPS export ABC transporter periplasmic protein LptC [Candidatus Egerieousia sp.]